jgi:hypothetical protein
LIETTVTPRSQTERNFGNFPTLNLMRETDSVSDFFKNSVSKVYNVYLIS